MAALFDSVPPGPQDPMFDLKVRLDADHSAERVDIGAGVYRGADDTVPYELSAIKKAKELLSAKQLGHEYELTTGNVEFTTLAAQLMFSPSHPALLDKRIATAQTCSGTSANHIGAVFARKFLPFAQPPTVYVGIPAWGNYVPLFEHAGFKVVTYSYYDSARKTVDFKGVVDAVEAAEEGSLFVLQGCCHNPTGAEYRKDQWKELAERMQARKMFPFFDVAYQGLGRGTNEDAWSTRYFAKHGFEMIVAQSFSKHMGLYGERVGAVHVVTNSQTAAVNVLDQLRCLIRWEFSSSPAYGSRLATIVMADLGLRAEWQREVTQMRARCWSSREELYRLLTVQYRTPGIWHNLLTEQGLFQWAVPSVKEIFKGTPTANSHSFPSFSGLSPRQVETLVSKHHIYLPSNGRINVAGLNPRTIPIVAKAIDEVVRGST